MRAAALVCSACGVELPDTAKFCLQCGAVVSAATTPAEYKQVTVLFADVVHSMDIAAAVGTERLREIMTWLVERSAAVVQRYGGTVDKFTGDGIMAVFGAPAALEDHAFRACLAALDIQSQAAELAEAVQARDGIDLQLRIGLNSGQAITGEIGSAVTGYTAIGEQVGLAQRMESVAPPGGVMLSASTARLVEHAAVLGEPEMVRIKGVGHPVPARRLLGLSVRTERPGTSESALVGREWELTTVAGILHRSVGGRGSVVGVVGTAGIGKTRLVREAARLAKDSGVEVFSTFCQSHATEVPFHVVARLLRAVTQVEGLDESCARARLRERFADADPEDMLLLDDLLGVAEPGVVFPKIHPDARWRRLTALVNAASLARERPVVYVIEDVHWIDEVSESMIAEFLAVISQTPSLALVTHRPEYRGALSRLPGAQTIALAPLSDSETAMLVSQLLGSDPSVAGLAALIAERAAGNPFFAEEIVRDLAERGVLRGDRRSYVSTAGAAEVSVPATVQATIAARIDRLDPAAKRTLSAAAVIGSRFDRGLLESLGVEPLVEELVTIELVDPVNSPQGSRYVFRHPMIRTVAYEAQLKSDRAELHRRLASVLESGELAAEQNAALIAEHLEAAGDLHGAYGWHMRAATWATNRDTGAARQSWERAQKIADALPAKDPRRAAMRITPRTMLCGTAWRVHEHVARADFEELRHLCTAAGDEASLAIGTAGLLMDHVYQGRMREASRLASEGWARIESLGDPALTVGLSPCAMRAKLSSAEFSEVLRWSERVIDLAEGDPSKGNFILGSPLAVAFAQRAVARYFLGHSGWRNDQRYSLAMARGSDAMSYVAVVTYVYGVGIPHGVLRPDDSAVREIEAARQVAERSGDDFALAHVLLTLGFALVHQPMAAERDRGQTLLRELSGGSLRREQNPTDLPINVYLARERARRGDRDAAIPLMRADVDNLILQGELLGWGTPTMGVLVETLLDRGAESDLAEAETAIERLASAPTDEVLVSRDVWLLRLRALLARARGDVATYTDLRDRYRDMAKALGYEGHMDWAEAMP